LETSDGFVLIILAIPYDKVNDLIKKNEKKNAFLHSFFNY